jgi:hypothetical protein
MGRVGRKGEVHCAVNPVRPGYDQLSSSAWYGVCVCECGRGKVFAWGRGQRKGKVFMRVRYVSVVVLRVSMRVYSDSVASSTYQPSRSLSGNLQIKYAINTSQPHLDGISHLPVHSALTRRTYL